MATNITDLKFDDGQQINVVYLLLDGSTFTAVCDAIDMRPEGVMFDHVHPTGGPFRTFLPWSTVNRIYQDLAP